MSEPLMQWEDGGVVLMNAQFKCVDCHVVGSHTARISMSAPFLLAPEGFGDPGVAQA